MSDNGGVRAELESNQVVTSRPSATASDQLAVQGEADTEDADLRTGLTSLSLLANADLSLAEVLTRVAEYAVLAIPNADGAGVTLLEKGHPDTIVASTEFVRQVDAVQYCLGQGPSITAAAEGHTVRSGSLGTDGQWPRFGSRVQRLGVHSVLSLPLVAEGASLGAMNVYAHQREAFDNHTLHLAELFAIPAAIAVQNAQLLAQTQRLTTQLHIALQSRAIIDQALGVVRSRTGCSEADAMQRLRRTSQTENRKLAVIAQEMVNEAVRRARARHAQ